MRTVPKRNDRARRFSGPKNQSEVRSAAEPNEISSGKFESKSDERKGAGAPLSKILN